MPLRIDPLDFLWYIPTYRGNRERWATGEEPEPFRVEIKPFSYADARALAHVADQGRHALSDDDTDAYFRAHVRAIQGLWIGGVEVTSGEQLLGMLDRVEPDLLRELNGALLDRSALDAGAKKNSGSPPG